MARTSGRPEVLFDSILDRLREQNPGIVTESNSYHTVNPADVISPSPGELVFAVAPLSASADEGYFEGGGLEQVTMNGGFIVRVLSPIALDQYGRSAAALTERSRGLWRIARLVIRALADPAWSPTDELGNEITRDIISFAGYDLGDGDGHFYMELRFRLVFDWDLSETLPEATD